MSFLHRVTEYSQHCLPCNVLNPSWNINQTDGSREMKPYRSPLCLQWWPTQNSDGSLYNVGFSHLEDKLNIKGISMYTEREIIFAVICNLLPVVSYLTMINRLMAFHLNLYLNA